MSRFAMIAAAVVSTAGAASAQFPTQPYSQNPYQNQNQFYQPGPFSQYPTVQPNIYNPVNQPLSPYLNLFRGNNPAVNYYYGVRPGTVGGTGFGFGMGAPFTASGGNRPLFFPQLLSAPDPLEAANAEGDAKPSILPPAGHPAVFNNTLGYFPSPYGSRGGRRTGLMGVGNRTPSSGRR
jgi:hypothetical protein